MDTELTLSFEALSREERIFEELKPVLLKTLEDEYAPLEELELRKQNNSYAVYYLQKLIFSMFFGKKSNYLLFPASMYLPFKPPADEKIASNGQIRVDLENPENTLLETERIVKSLTAIICKQPKEFLICAGYMECSNAKKCIRPREFSLKCNYKQVMRSGRIFYGKNRNIDNIVQQNDLN